MPWDEEEAVDEYGNDGWSIWSQLREFVVLWLATYNSYWGVEAGSPPEGLGWEEWEAVRVQNDHALALLKMIDSLSMSGTSPNPASDARSTQARKRLRRFLGDYAKLRPIRDRVDLALADQLVMRADGTTDRAIRLLGILTARPLSGRAAAYIARAASLYIHGWEVEAGIMCRAALEAALLDRFQSEIDQDKDPPPLKELIRIAGSKGVLSGFIVLPRNDRWYGIENSGVWRARRIQHAGNHIVHDHPTFPPEEGQLQNAFEALRDLSLVVGELFPPQESS